MNKEVSSCCPSCCCFALSLYPLLSRAMRTFSHQHSHKRILPTVVLEKTIKLEYLQTRLSGNSNLPIEFCSSQWNIVPPYNIKPLVYFAVLKREKKHAPVLRLMLQVQFPAFVVRFPFYGGWDRDFFERLKSGGRDSLKSRGLKLKIALTSNNHRQK